MPSRCHRAEARDRAIHARRALHAASAPIEASLQRAQPGAATALERKGYRVHIGGLAVVLPLPDRVLDIDVFQGAVGSGLALVPLTPCLAPASMRNQAWRWASPRSVKRRFTSRANSCTSSFSGIFDVLLEDIERSQPVELQMFIDGLGGKSSCHESKDGLATGIFKREAQCRVIAWQIRKPRERAQMRETQHLPWPERQHCAPVFKTLVMHAANDNGAFLLPGRLYLDREIAAAEPFAHAVKADQPVPNDGGRRCNNYFCAEAAGNVIVARWKVHYSPSVIETGCVIDRPTNAFQPLAAPNAMPIAVSVSHCFNTDFPCAFGGW